MKQAINHKYFKQKFVINEKYGDKDVITTYSKRAAELEKSDFNLSLSTVFNKVHDLDDFGIVILTFGYLSFRIEKYGDNRFGVMAFDCGRPAYDLDKTLSQVAKVKELFLQQGKYEINDEITEEDWDLFVKTL